MSRQSTGDDREPDLASGQKGDHTILTPAPNEFVPDEAEPASQIPPDSEWLEIDQTVQMLREKGITRTVRSIQRYCSKNKLNCNLTPTENGVRYLIERNSVERFVERHNQTLPSVHFGSQDTVQPDQQENPTGVDMDSGQAPEPGMADPSNNGVHLETVLSMKDQQIDLLSRQLEVANRQLEVKDDLLASLVERDHETNVLIQNLQRMAGLPEPESGQHPQQAPLAMNNDHQPGTSSAKLRS